MTKNEICGILSLAHFNVEEGLVPCPRSFYKVDGLIVSTVGEEQKQRFFIALDYIGARLYSPGLYEIDGTWLKWRRG